MNIKRQKMLRLSLSYFVIFVMCAIIFYPLLWIIGSSFNPGDSLSGSSIIPQNATLDHYRKLLDLENSNYLLWYKNTLKVSVLTMIFSVLAISFTAYAFSRYRFVGRKNGLLTFLILQMIPNFAALIALYVLAQLTGLIDTHLALILIYVGGAIPMNTWLMKGYFDTIPKELDESARMDGAGHFRIFLANHYAACKDNRSGCSVIHFHRSIYRFHFSEYHFAHTRKLYFSSWII